MSKEREGNNRRLAEWLGWQVDDRTQYCTECNERHSLWQAPTGDLWKAGVFLHVPDFYTDEAANALVLEKLPDVTLERGLRGWTCSFYVSSLGRLPYYDMDRKTAIAMAALKLIESEEK